MGKIQGGTTAARRQGRRWRFATAAFDETTWILTVDGRVAPIEGKPLELLHELLLRAGELVSKDELLEAVWPDVSVVEASLPTAVAKLRRALCDDGRGPAIVETVPRIGYRLAAAVEVQAARTAPGREPAPGEGLAALGREAAQVRASALQAGRSLRWLLAAAGFALMLTLGATLAPASLREAIRPAAPTPTQQDAKEALRELDIERIKLMLRAGWNPNTPFDKEGNGALNILMNVCEWDRDHDRHKLVLMARTLFDGGARLETRNVWGDTAYSIAKAPRYCGPDHPVTQMLHAMCYDGYQPLGDRCLPVYKHVAE
jgi:DNA-binding winged helix-turn-helix (wHTH) protein